MDRCYPRWLGESQFLIENYSLAKQKGNEI
jgi:hypothetical protein